MFVIFMNVLKIWIYINPVRYEFVKTKGHQINPTGISSDKMEVISNVPLPNQYHEEFNFLGYLSMTVHLY